MENGEKFSSFSLCLRRNQFSMLSPLAEILSILIFIALSSSTKENHLSELSTRTSSSSVVITFPDSFCSMFDLSFSLSLKVSQSVGLPCFRYKVQVDIDLKRDFLSRLLSLQAQKRRRLKSQRASTWSKASFAQPTFSFQTAPLILDRSSGSTCTVYNGPMRE